MRRITMWGLSTISALVLLFSCHTSTNQDASASVVAESDTGEVAGEGAASGGPAAGGPTTGTVATQTYTGDAVTTRFGDVQVEITVENGRITASEVAQVPWSNPRDQQINARAVPVLNAEVVEAQGADIDLVSGATYTSEGYIGSLQSALDEANL